MSEILSVKKNPEGLPEAKIMDQEGLNQALGNLKKLVSANVNIQDEFKAKLDRINGPKFKVIGHIVDPLNEALNRAQAGDARNLASELRISTVSQIQRDNEEKTSNDAKRQAAQLATAQLAVPKEKQNISAPAQAKQGNVIETLRRRGDVINAAVDKATNGV